MPVTFGYASALRYPQPYTEVVFTTTVTSAGSAHDTYTFIFRNWHFGNTGNTVSASLSQAPGTTVVSVAEGPVLSGGQYEGFGLDIEGDSNVFTGSDLVEARVDVYCGGALNSPTTPCCPPDPSLQAQLDQLLAMVTLIQRQSVPFAYVPGTVHAGLAGAGSFAIQGLLGVKVAVTTVPTPIGRAGTAPAEFFGLGFVSFGTPDGYPHSVKLEHNPQLILPGRCSAFTQFSYDLPPGAVVTVTELLREP